MGGADEDLGRDEVARRGRVFAAADRFTFVLLCIAIGVMVGITGWSLHAAF